VESTAPKRQAAYMLPADLVRRIKAEANERDCYPCAVVESACAKYLDGKVEARRPRPDRKAASA
jgi:hypothetical protein